MVTVRTINPSRIACVMKIINRTVEPHGLMIGHVSAGGVVDAAAEPVGSFPQVWLTGNGTPQIVVRECGFGSITNLVKEVRWQRLDEPDTDRFSDHSGYEGLVPVALLQRLAAVRGRLSLCADQAAAAKWWLSMPMASVSAEGPMPKALSTRRTSPLMPGCRHQGRACPLRRARMTSNPLIVA